MPLLASNEYIQVSGKVEILLAFPSVYTDLIKLGESENGIQVRKIPMLGEVPGDRYGGSGGPPIERQFFGLACEFNLAMSRWSPEVVATLDRMGGILTVPGTVPLANVGELIHRDHGIRFLLYAVGNPALSVNMPCCVWNSPQESGRGTKYSTMSMSVRAERAPEGFWAAGKVGVVYDSDITGTPEPYTPT